MEIKYGWRGSFGRRDEALPFKHSLNKIVVGKEVYYGRNKKENKYGITIVSKGGTVRYRPETVVIVHSILVENYVNFLLCAISSTDFDYRYIQILSVLFTRRNFYRYYCQYVSWYFASIWSVDFAILNLSSSYQPEYLIFTAKIF